MRFKGCGNGRSGEIQRKGRDVIQPTPTVIMRLLNAAEYPATRKVKRRNIQLGGAAKIDIDVIIAAKKAQLAAMFG